MSSYRKPTEYVCPECGIKNMDDTCDGFFECDECGNIISAPDNFQLQVQDAPKVKE